eukprot:COSAG05_NODE_2892_length_2535_cov_2.408867_5_plen_172_part_00
MHGVKEKKNKAGGKQLPSPWLFPSPSPSPSPSPWPWPWPSLSPSPPASMVARTHPRRSCANLSHAWPNQPTEIHRHESRRNMPAKTHTYSSPDKWRGGARLFELDGSLLRTALLLHLPRTGACPYNRPCAQQYVGKYQSCMVISGRLIVHAPVAHKFGCGWITSSMRAPHM